MKTDNLKSKPPLTDEEKLRQSRKEIVARLNVPSCKVGVGISVDDSIDKRKVEHEEKKENDKHRFMENLKKELLLKCRLVNKDLENDDIDHLANAEKFGVFLHSIVIDLALKQR